MGKKYRNTGGFHVTCKIFYDYKTNYRVIKIILDKENVYTKVLVAKIII